MPLSPTVEFPDIYGYMDYRAFLKAAYAAEKKRRRHFNYRYFADITGFGSTGFLKMVMDGERNLSPTSIVLFAKAFKLGKRESAYFEALVLFNQAKSDEERVLYAERLAALKPRGELPELERDKYAYFTRYYYAVIREMTALPGFKEDPEWIGHRLHPAVKAKEVEEALAALTRLGLVRRDDNGRLVQTEAVVSTPPEIQSLEVYRYHGQMLALARNALASLPGEERDITALTIPIPRETLPLIKKKIRELREDIIALVNVGPRNFHEVYQINIQGFPVTRADAVGGE